MKLFFATIIAALFVESEATSAISRYELLANGDGTVSAPYAKVETLEPFSGKVYFEAANEDLIRNHGDDKVDLNIELYGGAGPGECNTGTKLTVESSFYVNKEFSPFYTKITPFGKLGYATFLIDDFRSDSLEKPIYTRDDGDAMSGKIKVCARIAVTATVTGEIVSYIDTHIEVDVDLTANFQTFTQEVQIGKTVAKSSSADLAKVIDLESFLCGTSGVNNGEPLTSVYKIGQDFQVCVQPTATYSDEYSIESFKNVTCKNANLKRTVISTLGVGDALTDVVDSIQGSKSPADADIPGDGFTGIAGGKAFKSVVTAGFFDASATTPETAFTCTGEAVLKYTQAPNRLLVGTWTHFHDPTTNDPSRDLQETSTTEPGPFATTIGLSSDGADVDVLTAPAFLASHGWSSCLIVGVAGAAMMAIAVI